MIIVACRLPLLSLLLPLPLLRRLLRIVVVVVVAFPVVSLNISFVAHSPALLFFIIYL